MFGRSVPHSGGDPRKPCSRSREERPAPSLFTHAAGNYSQVGVESLSKMCTVGWMTVADEATTSGLLFYPLRGRAAKKDCFNLKHFFFLNRPNPTRIQVFLKKSPVSEIILLKHCQLFFPLSIIVF